MSGWTRSSLLVLLAVALAVPAAADTTLRIFTTSSVKGELRDCGCKGKPLGGFAERATLLQKNTAGADATLLVDGGNWSETKGETALSKTELLWTIMAELGYDAVTVGDREMSHGLGTLIELQARHPEIHVVSANVTDKSDALVWDTHTVVEKNGIRIGITGVTTDASYRFAQSRGKLEHDDFAFRDPAEALGKVLPILAEQSDVIVVLAHSGAVDAGHWAKANPDIDVLVVGYDPGYSFSPTTEGETLVIRGGSQGKYLTVLDLTLDAEGNRVDAEGESKPVNRLITPDPKVEEMVTAWEKANGVYEPKVEASGDSPVGGGK